MAARLRIRFGTAAVASLAAAVILLTPSLAPAAERARDARAWPRGLAAVGYRSDAALRDAIARGGGAVVRTFPRLHVAEVRPRGDVEAFARALERAPGISYVERL